MSQSDGPSFTLEIGEELLVRFVSGRVLGSRRGDEPICVLRLQPGDLMPFMIWLGEHRDQWRGWRTYGEAAGARALAQRLMSLRKETGREAPDAFDLDLHRDEMGVDLVAEFSGRTAILASHRFARADDGRTIKERYRNTDNPTRWSLFEAACILDRQQLAAVIESIFKHGTMLGNAETHSPPTVH